MRQEPLGRDVNREVCALTFPVNLLWRQKTERRWWVVPGSRGYDAASLRSRAERPGRGAGGTPGTSPATTPRTPRALSHLSPGQAAAVGSHYGSTARRK